MASNQSTDMQPASVRVASDMNGDLDASHTALVLVHMVNGVAGDVDTPFNQLVRRRAQETGIIGVQARLLDAFRTAKAKVPRSHTSKGSPGSGRTPRCGAPCSTVSA